MKERRIETEKASRICDLFASDIPICEISGIVGCDDRTVRQEFIRTFGLEQTNHRSDRIWKLHAGNVKHRYSIESAHHEIWEKVVSYFSSDMPLKEVGKQCRIAPATVSNIWRKHFGCVEYAVRAGKMRAAQRAKADLSLQKACAIGSRNEILCLQLLRERLETVVVHHDYDVADGLELDIIIPIMKIAISWDGVGHRKPVFGETAFRRTCANDHCREAILTEKGWRHISVVDDGSHNPKFVKRMVDSIIGLLPESWQGKKELE